MITTTAVTSDPTAGVPSAPTAPTARSRLARLTRRVLAAVAIPALASGAVLVTAEPASAATSVSYCFRDVYGAPFALRDTRIEVWTGAAWHTVAYDRTGTTGCSHVNTYPWRAYYVRVSAGLFTSNFVGSTPRYALPGNYYGVNLGTGYVYLRR